MITKSWHWGEVDRDYTVMRRWLAAEPAWRYGPDRIHQVAHLVHERLSSVRSIVGARYADVGAGCHHPLGTCTALYLNGLSFAVALDAAPTDERRAAEALYDLLVDCLVDPDRWHWSELARERFLLNIRRFDLKALRSGDLAGGIAGVPIRHAVCDLADPPLHEGSLDLMSSQAVLEHFLDHERVLARLHDLLAPGGVGVHHIDLTDHRRYEEPDRYHPFSFLAEADDWSDGLCNRLRASEFLAAIEAAGFETRLLAKTRLPLPEGFRARIAGRFRAMPLEELETTNLDCLTIRPDR